MTPERRSLTLLSSAFALVCALPSAAQADEPWLLGFEADLAVPILAPTMDRFHPGAAASVSLHFALSDAVLFGARLRGGFLSDAPAPADVTLADPGVGDFTTLGLSLRLRPLAPLMPGVERGTGAFVEIGGGAALTGGVFRPAAELALGWGFAVDDVDLAPVVRWMSVFEVDNQLEERPAHVLLVGLEVSLFDARPSAEVPAPEPVGDRDGDGLADDADECPDEPEDADGFEDEDGCPDRDNDADGVPDTDDECPLEPEDADGFEDEDGCPDTDNDRDGIEDARDACPDEAEVVNGVDDLDGCPDEGLIEMLDDRIVLEDQVLFDFSRARVRTRGRATLMAIVGLYQQHPEWTRLRIEGHADRRGTTSGNRRLSEMRAQRVRQFLVANGVPEAIIDAVGFGDSRPRVRGDTEEAHRLNRRVEFVVLARRGPPPGEPEPASEEAPSEVVGEASSEEAAAEEAPSEVDAEEPSLSEETAESSSEAEPAQEAGESTAEGSADEESAVVADGEPGVEPGEGGGA